MLSDISAQYHANCTNALAATEHDEIDQKKQIQKVHTHTTIAANKMKLASERVSVFCISNCYG